jgi:hypothetical protein
MPSFDIPYEHLDHELWALRGRCRAAEVEVERDVVAGIEPSADDDVERGPLGHQLDARYVAAQPDDSEID